MDIVDSHCHLDATAFDIDRSDVLVRCVESGVTRIVIPGIQAKSWRKQREICSGNPSLFAAFGMHPLFLESHNESSMQQLEDYISRYNPIAVGEIGLDYYLTDLDRLAQQQLFEDQLAIAADYKLPVILHARKSHDQILSTLKRYPVKGGICHAFNGSLQQASKYIDMGFKLGFGGMLTYEGSHKLRKLAVELPIGAIVLETDAPDMSGKLHKGERNSPEYLPEILQVLSGLRNQNIEDIATHTTKNAEAIFDFKDNH